MDAAPNYRRELDRHQSFGARPGLSYCCKYSSSLLAAEGFYLSDVTTTTLTCFACRVAKRGWECVTTPIREKHLDDNPCCIRFLNEAYFLTSNTPLEGSGPTKGEISVAQDLLTLPKVVRQLQQLLSNWELLHWPRQLHRLASFEHAAWQQWDYKRKAPVLAHLGFRYTGRGNVIQTFCCGFLLRYSDIGIDAEGEHKRHDHYQGCRFTPGSNECGNITWISPEENFDEQLRVHNPGVVIAE